MFTRRQWLLGSAALGGGLLLPRVSRASVAPKDRKFIFVLAKGGWDVTKVFAPVFSSSVVHEPGDSLRAVGNLQTVSTPTRPIVDQWFDANVNRLVKIDGILVRSINHPVCRRLWMTNTTDGSRPDWPTLIGAAAADRYTVPHIVIEGNSISNEYAAYTMLTGANGEMERLVQGSATTSADLPFRPFSADVDAIVDGYTHEAGVARQDRDMPSDEAWLANSYTEAVTRLTDFQTEAEPLDLSGDGSFATQVDQTVQYLGAGIARCVTLKFPLVFDTHNDNSIQDDNLAAAFTYLGVLNRALERSAGTMGGSLMDETVVVVYSEMGRTPYINSANGKDHWMYTSCMVYGAGVQGNRQFGGYDDILNGKLVDLASGDLDPNYGIAITPDVIGSSLLTLAGIDPASILGADTTLQGMIAS